MKKYWKIIITLCVITIVGLEAYEFYRGLNEQFIDVVGEDYYYDEDKTEIVYVDSYTFDGEEIQFYFDNHYGIRGSYMMKGDRKINLYTQEPDFKSKNLKKIFNAVVMNVDNYDVYADGVLLEPTIIENEKVKIKIYEYDADAYVVAVDAGTQNLNEYSVMECKENRTYCDIEMNMDLDVLQQHIDSWERIRRVDELPDNKVTKGLFNVKSKFYVYEYLHEFNEKHYSFAAGVDENGVAYAAIGGNLNMNLAPRFRLTKEQYDDFMEFVESCKVIKE